MTGASVFTHVIVIATVLATTSDSVSENVSTNVSLHRVLRTVLANKSCADHICHCLANFVGVYLSYPVNQRVN